MISAGGQAQHQGAQKQETWNLMDGHSMVRESEKCNYTIEAWGRRCYLVQTNRETKAIDRYEILNCTYEQLRGKISKRHEAEEVPAR